MYVANSYFNYLAVYFSTLLSWTKSSSISLSLHGYCVLNVIIV